MPRQKDLKRLVRARMSKTGESYTAARAKIIARSSARTAAVGAPGPRVAAVAATAPDYAALAGMSDATNKARTGCTWERWVYALDRRGADKMSHREIASLINTKYKIDGWWSQSVTVGYERIKGLRARGQRRDGTYEANKSKTFDVPVDALFEAWSDDRLRKRWLDARVGKVRTATAPKSMRLDGAGRSIIAVGFMPKGPSRSAVAVQHTKLRDRDEATQLKVYWAERLAALGALLAAG
jgi:hypothetical protein